MKLPWLLHPEIPITAMISPLLRNYPANMADPAGSGKSTFLSNTLMENQLAMEKPLFMEV